MAEVYVFERPARRPFSYAMVGVAVVGLLALIFGINAHPLVITLFALIIAPAIWDVIKGNTATLEITETSIAWKSGAREATVPFENIDEAVLSTTLDFSQRATLHFKGGGKVRIPVECLPPGRVLDQEFTSRNIPNKRSLFSF